MCIMKSRDHLYKDQFSIPGHPKIIVHEIKFTTKGALILHRLRQNEKDKALLYPKKKKDKDKALENGTK